VALGSNWKCGNCPSRLLLSHSTWASSILSPPCHAISPRASSVLAPLGSPLQSQAIRSQWFPSLSQSSPGKSGLWPPLQPPLTPAPPCSSTPPVYSCPRAFALPVFCPEGSQQTSASSCPNFFRFPEIPYQTAFSVRQEAALPLPRFSWDKGTLFTSLALPQHSPVRTDCISHQLSPAP
jgi:hypothetical protein